MSDTKPPVEPGDIAPIDARDGAAWVPAKELAKAQAALDECKAENKWWRVLFRRVQDALFNGRSRKDDFDSQFPL